MSVHRSVLNQELLQAVLNRDGLAIQRLIDLGADVNYHPGDDIFPSLVSDAGPEEIRKVIEERVVSNNAFGTPLLLAALYQDVNAVEILLNHGANYNYDEYAWFRKTLRELALQGAHETMALLGEYGDQIVSTPRTALCATLGQTDNTSREKLLQGRQRADPNFPLGWPLVIASSAANEDAVRRLLEIGATQSIVKPWSLEFYDVEQDAIVKDRLFPLVNLDKRRELCWSAIGVAASQGFANIVELLLSGESLNIQACNEAFWLASQAGNDEVVQIFLAHGFHTSFDVGFAQGNPVIVAARNGRESTVALLLKHDADPDFRVGNTPSALEQAISFGHKNIAKMLLSAGADPDGRKEGDNTPLIKAVEREDLEFCQALLDHGANINSVCSYLGSALAVAASVGNLQIFHMLLSRGARLDVKENGLTSTISGACGGGFIGDGSVEVIQALLDAGLDVNQPTANGTPLQIAAFRKKKTIVRFLVEKGADIHTRSNTYNKNTPLESAVMGGDVEIVKFLLEKGAKVADAVTLLQLGATFADENMVEFLIDTNPQLAHMEHQFPAILDSAATSENFKAIRVILERTKTNIATDYTLKKAVRGNDEDLTKLLLTKGSTIGSALGWAISYKQKSMCWTLINHYVGDEDKSLLDSALLGAALNGWQDMADNVLNRGANVNAVLGTQPDSDSILLSAVSSGHVPTIQLLLDRGVDLSKPGALGKALQRAAGNERIKRLLVSKSKRPVAPQISSNQGTPASEQHVKSAPPDIKKTGKSNREKYEPPQPPLVARYRVQMSTPLNAEKKTKEEVEAELQVQLKIEAQAVAEYEKETEASGSGSAGATKGSIVAADKAPQSADDQIYSPYVDDREGYKPYDDNQYSYVNTYDDLAEIAPAAREYQVPAAIQPPVDGLEKPVAISNTVSTCNLTLAVFRADSKGTVQRKLRICRPNRPERAVADIDTDEKLFRAMRKTYNHDLSSLPRRIFYLKSLKQITVLSYTATTRPTPVPYDDFTLQEIMYLYRHPYNLSSSPSLLSHPSSAPSTGDQDQPWIDWVFRLKTSDNGRKHILRFEEAWDGSKIAIAGSMPCVASLVIAVAWSTRGGDIQTVFAVASFVLGAGTALLALVGILSSVGS